MFVSGMLVSALMAREKYWKYLIDEGKGQMHYFKYLLHEGEDSELKCGVSRMLIRKLGSLPVNQIIIDSVEPNTEPGKS